MAASAPGFDVPSRLQRTIAELRGSRELLLSGDVDPRILTDFRDALNRVRNTAWAAQQYVARKESGQDSESVLTLLAGERIRAAHQLCRVICDDLAKPEIRFQAGNLVQLHEVAQALTEKLQETIKELG